MTLAPVFRSKEGTDLLLQRGIVQRLAEHIVAQRAAMAELERRIADVLGEQFRRPGAANSQVPDLEFLQDHFFLILFRSVFAECGAAERIDFYTRVNICIKGIITAADNIFDNDDKELLPLKVGSGRKFTSIMQLMTFERLMQDLGREARDKHLLEEAQFRTFLRDLLARLAFIGALEGSEEDGVSSVPTVEDMIERVHRIRGGALFSLAFAAPFAIEKDQSRWKKADAAISKLGTAFQIVDDLTDFEFDIHRGSNNLLVSRIVNDGTDAERQALADLRQKIASFGDDWEANRERVMNGRDAIDEHFSESALAVLRCARTEARTSFEELAALGFWFDPADSDEVVHAIVGMEGVHRMEKLVEKDRTAAGR